MDVRCTRCGVEYEFDDEKVKPSGVTVKCTSCGHVFKVKREAADDAPSPDATTASLGEGWMVRHPDGTVVRFKELTTLQKWIVEQRVGRDDEISKTGRSWKRLGEIAELSSFFQVVDAAKAARQQAFVTPMPALAPVQAPPAAASLPTPTPTPATRPTPAPTPAPPRPSESGFFGADGSDVDDLDDEDPVRAWKRRGRLARVAAAVVVTGALGTGGLYFFARPTFDRLLAPLVGEAKAPAPDPLDARLVEIAKALSSDDAAALDRGITELEAAATDDKPRALALLSRLYTARARAAKEQARLAAAKGEAGREEALGHDKRHGEHLARAYELASRARAAAPTAAESDLAFAAYQEAKGALAEMQTDLESARAHAKGRPDEADIARAADAIAALAAAPKPTAERADGEAPLAGATGANEAAGDAPAAVADKPAPDEADDDEKAAPSAPADYDDLVRRADRLRDRGRTKSALSYYKKALEQRPTAARALSGAGWCYIDLGSFSRAASSFRKAIAADSSYAVAHFGLAESLRFAGDKAGAVRAYQKYLELDPAGPDAPVARNALEALK